MVDTLFVTVLKMTVTGSIAILAILLARLLLRKAPKVITYGLWLVVLLRLLCPVSVQLPISILPEVASVSPNYALDEENLSFAEVGAAAISSVEDMLSGGSGVQQIPVKPQPDSQAPAQKPQDQSVDYIYADANELGIFLCSYLWIAGFAAMAFYSLISTGQLKRNLREAILLEKGIYQTDRIDTPFVMGLFVPRIYLPAGLEGREKSLILAHEKHHIRRLDPLWKALGFLALSIHWFNPLVWLAFIMACRDMEMSCDEAVLKSMGEDVRGEYAAALLNITTGRRSIGGSPLAFGESDPKGRIRNLSKWKKPLLWISVVAVVACAVLAVCLLTDPVSKAEPGCGISYYFGYLDSVGTDKLTMTCEDGRVLDIGKDPNFALPKEMEGSYVMVRSRWKEQQQRYMATSVEEITVPAYYSLEKAIENAILLLEGNLKEKERAAFTSFATVVNKKGQPVGINGEKTVTVYGYALCLTFGHRDGLLQETSGSHIPVAITFRLNSEGGYCLAEYWMPRDGSYYADDLRQKFPGIGIPDGQKYIAQQQSECQEKAYAYFSIEQPQSTEPTVPPTTEQTTGFDIAKVPVGDSLPIEELRLNYSREDAIRDGVVVMESDSAYANEDIWEAFVEHVQAKTPARVRVMNCVVGAPMRMEEILFDGEYFLVRRPMYYTDGRYAETLEFYYDYFAVFNREVKDEEGRVYRRYIRYGLSAWPLSGREPTWDVFHMGGDIIAFQYLTEYILNPDIPETLVSASLMLEDLTLGTASDHQKLESLRDMLAKAEYDPAANTVFAMEELYLDLTFDDGTRLQLPLFPELDKIIIDGKVYDYGPWDTIKKDGNQNYVADYNALLDLVRHFGLDDWPEAFRQWCMDRGIEPPRHSLKVLVGEEPHD